MDIRYNCSDIGCGFPVPYKHVEINPLLGMVHTIRYILNILNGPKYWMMGQLAIFTNTSFYIVFQIDIWGFSLCSKWAFNLIPRL